MMSKIDHFCSRKLRVGISRNRGPWPSASHLRVRTGSVEVVSLEMEDMISVSRGAKFIRGWSRAQISVQVDSPPLWATNPVVRSGEFTDVLEVSGKLTEKAPT